MKKEDKENRRKVRTYRKQLKSEQFELDNELVFLETGEVQIECKVGKIENIFSPFDIAKNRTISDSFHNYLMQETEIIPAKYDLELKLHVSDDTKPEQEEQIRKAIKRHYSFMITSVNVSLRKTSLSAMLLYFGGLVALLLTFLVEKMTTILPLKETLLIITWFFVWEATGVAFFDRNRLILNRFNMLRIYNAKVVFVKESQLKAQENSVLENQQNMFEFEKNN